MIEKKKTRSELKREAIISAAKDAFNEFGVQNTSMDKLASLAGVSKRTVYNHFESKEELVMLLLSELWHQSMADVDLTPLETKSVEEQLHYLLAHEIRILNKPSYIDLAKVAFGHYFYRPDELKEQAAKMTKQETALYKWLEQQNEEGVLKIDDIDTASIQLHSLIKGSCFWPQLMGMSDVMSEEAVMQLAQSTADLFLARYLV
ncbi:TetR/AcrR family transcriptional regulator [Vibrio sp. SCSIO 43140]|uniref:TetR/AcrR family transcriptional regulator n=1 Tax=Vibrio sp. SCSIO 43140 TaxID=2819100 RepID=UPI002076351C|nr:TetR/AcrR family transcriptional regulator [Vibrio sp. SCSIO 43140]USD63492.1 TetR/AcrR family transcriptional regulator [Vibrio sp. SCSIO 43140]